MFSAARKKIQYIATRPVRNKDFPPFSSGNFGQNKCGSPGCGGARIRPCTLERCL